MVPRTVEEKRTIHEDRMCIFGPCDISKEKKEKFPFSINLPIVGMAPGMDIVRVIKGVVAVKGRPDITYETTVSIIPPYAQVQTQTQAQAIPEKIVVTACEYCGAIAPLAANMCPKCGGKLFARQTI